MAKASHNSKKRRRYAVGIIAAVLIAMTVWIAWGNSALMLTEVSITGENIPTAFSGFRIAQISDLHNAVFGKDNEKLLSRLEEAVPDIIVMTGDLVDSRHTDVAVALDFASRAVQIAPVYYVPGNHEARISEYDALKSGLTDTGVALLEDEVAFVDCSGERLTLIGVRDPSFSADYLYDEKEAMQITLSELVADADGYTVLLSHRPELFESYVDSGVDLVFSGHAHGGQFRLPLIGGLVAPDQGFFPAYDAGLYTARNTNMVVSRGIGNSIIPFRANNRPEIVVVELSANNSESID